MTDHVDLARDLIDVAAHHPSLNATAGLLAEAQVHALLAVAHELRAANLIRYWSIVPESEGPATAVREYVAAAAQPAKE